jgi:predicted signal transduction protein with EAL and GGDEF domain
MDGSLADLAVETDKLRRRLDRERKARVEAEGIAERGLRELYEKQKQLELLEAIAVFANQAASVRDALKFAITRICEFTGWPLGHVCRVEAVDGVVSIVSTNNWYGAEAKGLQDFRHDTDKMRYPPGAGLPGRVLATGTPAWIVDVAVDDGFVRAGSAQAAGLRSAFDFPVMVHTEVAAVLEFFSYTELQPHPALLWLVAQIGTQLGRVVERQRSDEKLIHDASHDPLTGLPNRALFLDRLTRAIARNKRSADANFAILFIDLDRFKLVNDSLGHLAGDSLIIEVATRFRASLRQTDMVARSNAVPMARLRPEPAGSGQAGNGKSETYDTLARLGGDEFTVLLDDIQDLSDAVRIADRLLTSLHLPFTLQEQEIYVEASIGIALSATGYVAADEVLRDADLAMYRAKALGKSRYEVFDRTMHLQAMGQLALETDLRHALQNQEFILHYQPIVDLRSGDITGLEALVRWQKSEKELIYPGDFISVAEDTGLILHLGMWVLREACERTRAWQLQFPREKPLTISINLSARQFAQPDLVPQIRHIIEDTGIAPETVRLELTESVTMANAERAISVLAQLRLLGVRISIDDFGTGYSSLSYLHRFPLDVLKIDRSFVLQMDSAKEGLQIVHTILSLARNLNMEVVAEGVETDRHLRKLRALGCEAGQGYYFSRPVGVDAIRALLASPPDWSC